MSDAQPDAGAPSAPAARSPWLPLSGKAAAAWLVVGLGLMAALIYLSFLRASGSARTEGTVIRLELGKDVVPRGDPRNDRMILYEEIDVVYPVVEYQVGDRKYTFAGGWGSYAVGQKVPVTYDVGRPEVARIDPSSGCRAVFMLVGGLLVILGVGIAMAIVNRIHRKTTAPDRVSPQTGHATPRSTALSDRAEPGTAADRAGTG
jgi:Protein of unknown function (DUF3592)